MADNKIDSFDIGALERAVNDSAGRVSGIWLSFVAFSAYLAAAASMISHRQMFLEEPIKLPTVNIDLPLVASAILLPLLFVIYHIFVLLQVVLLARTADAYNEAIEHGVTEGADRTRIRQRLANTLFAQLFAGSPREREGVLGWMLRLMAWITLAIAPVCVLMVFEIKFLPYHSALLTWTHRGLVMLDVLAVLFLWAGAVNPHDDVKWRSVLRHQYACAISFALLIVCLIVATFPGEWHTKWARNIGHDDGKKAAECRTFFTAELFPVNFDRLVLPGEVFVDADKLASIEKVATAKKQEPYEGDRTRNFKGRDFRCANFAGADLRRTSFAGSDLSAANLAGASLQGADFNSAELKRVSFAGAQLQGATLYNANLEEANLADASIQGTILKLAHFHGTSFDELGLAGFDLSGADLAGASFRGAALQGAKFNGANLIGADFSGAQLQGATLLRVRLTAANLTKTDLRGAIFEGDFQGARLRGAYLQGARMNARLQGADLQEALLEGARMDGSQLTLALIDKAYLWGAGGSDPQLCAQAQVTEPVFDEFIDPIPRRRRGRLGITAEDIGYFVDRVKSTIPAETVSPEFMETFENSLRDRLTISPEVAEERKNSWIGCAGKALPKEEYDAKLVSSLIGVACFENQSSGHAANGIARHWVKSAFLGAEDLGTDAAIDPGTKALVRGLLGLDGRPCPGADNMNEKTRDMLRAVAAKAK
jgi:uncharacterized protein YjbI with pentapeptide repeats